MIILFLGACVTQRDVLYFDEAIFHSLDEDEQKDFQTIEDIDGNSYRTVQIGDYLWMAENLRTSRFSNGDPITNITNKRDWQTTRLPAWSYYNNDLNYENIYGKLYNGYTVINHRNICPIGWKTPSEEVWKELEIFLGMPVLAHYDMSGNNVASKLKSSTDHWQYGQGSNSTGFSALPGGVRSSFDGEFRWLGNTGYWWSSTIIYDGHLVSRNMSRGAENREYILSFNDGLNIRCIKKI